MSLENGCQEIDASRYLAMRDEELEEILRLDFYKEESDESLRETLLAMKILAERKRENGSIPKIPEEAFESFTKYYVPELDGTVLPDADTIDIEKLTETREKRPIIRWRRALAGIAAAVALVFFTTFSAKAMGFDFWEFVIQWTKETFSYHTGSAMKVPPPDTIGRYTASSESEFLEVHDMTTAFVPQWLPEGFVLDDMLMDETYYQREALFIYSCDQKEIQLSIKTSMSDEMYSIEKSDETYDVYESGGITMYLFENYDVMHGFWVTEDYECCLSGHISKEEIIDIFISMEKG